jgi:hypothetical protein
MPSTSVYIGIDVACALGKRLPVCIVVAGPRLVPLKVPSELATLIPRGVGNKEIFMATPFHDSALGVAKSIAYILNEMGWKVERIAVDAPAAPPDLGSRESEIEMGGCGLSSFRTPAVGAWPGILQKCSDHKASGGTTATLPHANKIWMLYGFRLFEYLSAALQAEVIEVYPFAIARALVPNCKHKSTEEGYQDQLAAIAEHTGWKPHELHERLKETVPGSRHDRLDAFMGAWVASLPPQRRRAFGDARRPRDAIWVPSITAHRSASGA